ncbi:MAG: SDR family NAD(P)-dependent oxidoreductase, partial [Desulfobacterales bacterium]|nr:SDR family NAD(P)-dependent oxidoreductase [Desulfobacterales bacterium]
RGAFRECQEYGVFSLFRLMRFLDGNGLLDNALELKVVTNNAWPVLPGERTRPYGAALAGFTACIPKEFPRIRACCLDLDGTDIADALAKDAGRHLVEKIAGEPGKNVIRKIAFRNGGRYEERLLPTNLPAAQDSPFREDGVYLIIGGLGAVGLVLARHLAEKTSGHLILMGRSPLTPEKKEKLDRIETGKASLSYVQSDITDHECFKASVEEIKSSRGPINGVFHSAMVWEEWTIREMDEGLFRSSLAPKVEGSRVLGRVFEREELDFMVFFSSAQSFFGNLKRSHYAAASTFQDAWALHLNTRLRFPVKTVNWGYWGTDNIVSDDEAVRIFRERGIQPILPATGMAA